MSAEEKPKLYLVPPPPQVDDEQSIEFMNKRLALSGLVVADIGAYPISFEKNGFCASFCIPYQSDGMWRTRHDREIDKYKQPPKIVDIWWPPQLTLEEIRNREVLFIIEGELKAARFYKEWPQYGVVGIGGAWNYAEEASNGTKRLLPNLIATLRPKKRVVAIFDGDITTKAGIQMAASALRQYLVPHACGLEIFYPPLGKGVDDWLQIPGEHAIADLIQIPFDQLEETRKQRYVLLGCKLKEGNLILNESNAKRILLDYFDGKTYVDRRLGVIHEGQITEIDHLENVVMGYLQDEENAHYKAYAIKGGLKMALDGAYKDVVQDELRRTKWDGVKRLDTWGSEYLSTDWAEYANAWGRVLMTGLALRILRPGTKVDKVCILAGPQGIGKSTFFEALSEFMGLKFYYVLSNIAESAADQNRTQGINFARSTIVDLAEGVVFETLRKGRQELIKQVITQVEDEYRPPYAKSVRVVLRGFIFVGTTNKYDQLADLTGSRRYMFLKVDKIKRLPYHIKMQILAEVMAQEEQLRDTDWWEDKLSIEAAPASWKIEGKHFDSVQEMANAGHQKADVLQECIDNFIDKQALEVKATEGGGRLITGYAFWNAYKNLLPNLTLDTAEKKVKAQMSNVTSPYVFTKVPQFYRTKLIIPGAATNYNLDAPWIKMTAYQVTCKPGHVFTPRLKAVDKKQSEPAVPEVAPPESSPKPDERT